MLKNSIGIKLNILSYGKNIIRVYNLNKLEIYLLKVLCNII